MNTVRHPSPRRAFLSQLARVGALAAGSTGAAVWLSARSRKPTAGSLVAAKPRRPTAPDPSKPDLVLVRNGSPEALVKGAVDSLGGMSRFVTRGQRVVVKPNIGWDRPPELAANTNPEVIAAVVRLCIAAGAGNVTVADVSCHEAHASYDHSGIAAAARAAGATVVLPEAHLFRDTDLSGETLGPQLVLEPFLTADTIINVAIAKNHSLTGVTLGMKNFYGLIGGQRNRLHQRIHESIVDLTAFAQPALTIIDAFRVLARNGPTGGSPADVDERRSLVAGHNPVAADAFAARTFFDRDPRQLTFLRLAELRGLGKMAVDAERVCTLDLGDPAERG